MQPKTPRNLSDQVRDAVRGSGLLAQEVAEAARVHKSALSRFLSGERGLSIEALDRIGRVLGLEIVARATPDKSGSKAGENTRARRKRTKQARG